MAEESALDFLARWQKEPGRQGGFLGIAHCPLINSIMSLSPGSIFFVVGEKSTGKTEYLLQALSSYLLPEQHLGVQLNGCDAFVVLFDNNAKFPMHRLLQLLKWKITSGLRAHKDMQTADFAESVLNYCLSRLLIVQATDAMQLRASILALPGRLEQIQGAKTGRVVVAVCSLDAFYWADRQEKPPLPKVEQLIINFIRSRENCAALCTCSHRWQGEDMQHADNVLVIRGPGILTQRDDKYQFVIEEERGFLLRPPPI